MVQVAQMQGAGRSAAARFSSAQMVPYRRSVAQLSLIIVNYEHVLHAFGEHAARAALDAVCRLIDDAFQGGGSAAVSAQGVIDVVVHDARALGDLPLAQACDAWLAKFCLRLPFLRAGTPSGPVHFWASGRWSISDAATGQLPETLVAERFDLAFRGEAPSDDESWAARYLADMALASGILSGLPFGEIAEGASGLAFAWQAVRDAHAPELILYHEALLRLTGADDQAQSAGTSIAALERLGFARAVDHHVVERLIDELVTAPDIVLAANISAQSACWDHWWAAIELRLRGMPDVARRLVIEITETAAIPSISDAVQFVGRIRRLGCRVALDDFGAGFASVRQLIALTPDFVKIDGMFVQCARASERKKALLTHLIGIASALGTHVVVEGVETAEQAQLACAAGASWQQGYYWGQPGLARPWWTGGVSDRACALDGVGRSPAFPIAKREGRHAGTGR